MLRCKIFLHCSKNSLSLFRLDGLYLSPGANYEQTRRLENPAGGVAERLKAAVC